jgi:hypothetical protein
MTTPQQKLRRSASASEKAAAYAEKKRLAVERAKLLRVERGSRQA